MPGKNTPTADAQGAAGSQLDERLDHLDALVTALSAEIDLLRAEREESEANERGAQAAGPSGERPGSDEVRADQPGEGTDAGLARVAALQLVDAGLSRKAVTAELQRLGMDDPQPIVDEVFPRRRTGGRGERSLRRSSRRPPPTRGDAARRSPRGPS